MPPEQRRRHLLSPASYDALRRLARARTLFAFDFDGTLAPIVGSPDEARIADGIRDRLVRLARKVPVAVISGRRLQDLRSRLPLEVIHCIGNHGNEGVAGAGVAALRRTCREWITQLRPQLLEDRVDSGIVLEDKGLTLSLHYRHARGRVAAARWLATRVRELDPAPRVIKGKLVLNLLPPGARTKFEALADLARDEAAEGVLFVGDDQTDELVFAQAPSDWVTVRIGRGATRAAYFLRHQSDVAVLLDRLLALLAAPESARATSKPSTSARDA